MPQPSARVPFRLTQTGVDVVLEEIFYIGWFMDGDRQLSVPPGARVTLKHEMSSPPFYWEVQLGPGLHTFLINQLWNKYKVRLESAPSPTVWWIL